jgi:hypothetical protein
MRERLVLVVIQQRVQFYFKKLKICEGVCATARCWCTLDALQPALPAASKLPRDHLSRAVQLSLNIKSPLAVSNYQIFSNTTRQKIVFINTRRRWDEKTTYLLYNIILSCRKLKIYLFTITWLRAALIFKYTFFL